MINTMEKAHPDRSIVLASQSPRRMELLKQAGLDFSVVPSGIDETTISMVSPETYVKALAEAKAEDVSSRYPDHWIIGADTIVYIDDTLLEKPDSPEDARRMLKQLSGRTHQVYTGFCICCRSKARCHSETIVTDVHFKTLTDTEIRWYANTTEPYDKAGGYAIQGLGMFLVKWIKGSYTSVVGLPVCEVLDFFINEGIISKLST